MMRVEITELRRCCFCVPLRYGLLAWLYAKLIAIIVCLIMLSIVLFSAFFLPGYVILIFVLVFSTCLNDIGFSIVFIVGAHKKNYKLMRPYYYFALAATAMYTLTFSLICGIHLYYYIKLVTFVGDPNLPNYVLKIIFSELVAYLLSLAIHGYLILLIRSEILKLKRNCMLEFVNKTSDSECRVDVNIEGAAI